MKAPNATPASGTSLSGLPFTLKVPPAKSRSSGLASSMWAAMARALSMTCSVAIQMAVPPTASDRDP